MIGRNTECAFLWDSATSLVNRNKIFAYDILDSNYAGVCHDTIDNSNTAVAIWSHTFLITIDDTL